jgi:hypothetical protein
MIFRILFLSKRLLILVLLLRIYVSAKKLFKYWVFDEAFGEIIILIIFGLIAFLFATNIICVAFIVMTIFISIVSKILLFISLTMYIFISIFLVILIFWLHLHYSPH